MAESHTPRPEGPRAEAAQRNVAAPHEAENDAATTTNEESRREHLYGLRACVPIPNRPDKPPKNTHSLDATNTIGCHRRPRRTTTTTNK